jgi:ferritin-like metal-binding protein YciE
MPTTTLDEQLTAYISDAHSIESQALAQMKAAPKIAEDSELETAFRQHLTETERHERLMRERLEAHGGSPSAIKEAVMKAGGVAFVLFARSQPDTPGKLAAHGFSYEHLELASYELLRRVAERAGDMETAAAARSILEDERAMAQRLEANFERAVEASLRDLSPDDLAKQLVKYLCDAHAIEAQAIQLLGRGQKIGGDPELARIFREHLEETRRQQQRVEQRLAAHDAHPSALKDAAMRLGALNWGAFFQAQPDTPGKLCAFAYAFEHLEIAGYEELRLVAKRAGDEETVRVAEGILAEERAAARKLADAFDRVVSASLEAQGLQAA